MNVCVFGRTQKDRSDPWFSHLACWFTLTLSSSSWRSSHAKFRSHQIKYKNCPRSRIEVRPTALPRTHALDLATAAGLGRHAARLSELARSWWRDNKNVLLWPSVIYAIHNRNLNPNSWTLTYDLDFQPQASYGHDPYAYKKVQRSVGSRDRVATTNGWTDGRTRPR